MNLKISDQLIRQAAYFPPTYERGKSLFQTHKVKEVHFFKNKQQGSAYEIHALVHGQQDHYKTLIGFSNPYGFHSVNCECPAYNKYHECCKHIIATLFQAQQLLSESDSITWTDGTAYKQQLTATNLLKEYEASLLNEISISSHEDKVKLVPKLKRRGQHFTLEASIGRKRLYVIKDFFTFVEHVQNKTEMNYGKEFTFNHDRSQFESESLKLLDFLTKLIIDQRTYHQEFKGYMPDKKSLYLTHPQFESFYETFKGTSIPSQFENMNSKTTLLTDELAPIQLSVTQTKKGIVINHTQSNLNFFQTNTNLFLVTEGQINLCPPAFKRDMFPLLKQIVLSDGPLTMNTELIPGFLSTILPRIQQYVTPESLHQLNQQYDIYPLHSEIYLDVNEDKAVVAKVNYQYGELSFNPFEETDTQSI
ncbi:MAG: SNF2 helicase associated domain-containing protein, partial [Turicibacter sp.]